MPGAFRRIAVGGASFKVADNKPTFWDRVAAGTWEPGTFAALNRIPGAGTTLLDLGAWVGPVTLYAAARGARVVAVEADPAALVQLRANIAANPDLAPRITVVDRAVAPQPGLVRMGARRKLGDSMSSTLLRGADRTWQIAAITPAELARLIGPSERLVVKIDIEGGEYALLPTLGPLIARPGTAVLLSLHPQILRESGAGDLIERTRAALAPFAGWNAFALDGVDVVPASPEHAAFAPCRDWLFVKACRHSELGPGAPKF